MDVEFTGMNARWRLSGPELSFFDASLRHLRNRFASQLFTQHQRKCGLQRHFALILRPGDRVRSGSQFGCRIQVRTDTAEIIGTQSLVPCLLDCIIAGACRSLWWGILHMHGLIMMAQLQRETIGKATRLCHLLFRQISRRKRHAKICTASCWRIRAPGNFHFRLARNCAAGAGQHMFEFVKGGFVSQ